MSIKRISVVYQDESIVIFNKPAGLLTIPAPDRRGQTLLELVNEEESRGVEGIRLSVCHRLDAETSGLIVFARGKAVQKKVMDLFKTRAVTKTYLAMVHGRLGAREGAIRIPLEGRAALSLYRVLREGRACSLVEVRPHTGRRNQIRLHFKALGHPLVGETRFAFRKDYALRASRAMLHAWRLSFVHPVRNDLIDCEAPLPPDFSAIMNTAGLG